MTDLDACLGASIRAEREARGWSVSELADRSGVSRAMIAKVEKGDSSPTAALLGRLSGAFGLSVSTLLARSEAMSARAVLRAADQPTWRDPETGYLRRQIAPAPGSDLPLDLVRIELPAGAEIAYPASAYAFGRRLIWVVEGTLGFVEGDTEHSLGAGDCLELGTPADCVYRNRSEATCVYLVAVLGR
ncbi:transcriptional regulator with XRE-family HTH domain [Amorphus suaedae]